MPPTNPKPAYPVHELLSELLAEYKNSLANIPDENRNLEVDDQLIESIEFLITSERAKVDSENYSISQNVVVVIVELKNIIENLKAFSNKDKKQIDHADIVQVLVDAINSFQADLDILKGESNAI